MGAVVDSPHDLFDTVVSREFGRASLRRELDDRARSRSTDRSAARNRSEHHVRVANALAGTRGRSTAAAHVRPGIDGIVLCGHRRGSVSGGATGWADSEGREGQNAVTRFAVIQQFITRLYDCY